MKRDLVYILACPTDKTSLDLSVEREDGDDIIDGALTCAHCGAVYPIKDSIPNLLPTDFGG